MPATVHGTTRAIRVETTDTRMTHSSLIGFIGLCCSSLCLLGLPLLIVWWPTLTLGRLHNEILIRTMSVMFLGMYGLGTFGAFRRHRRLAPLGLALIGGGLLLTAVWHGLPHLAEWLAFGILTLAWVWDWQLLRTHHGH